MLEKALTGSRGYWLWVMFLLIVIGIGFLCYLHQLDVGLGMTGMSRDVSWGLYIAQFTFLVGIAASAVMLVLPYYLHDYKAFGKITVLGEFLAVSAVIMCVTFIFVDLGQPARVMNVLLHPAPTSILFWDMIVLNGYLLINIVTGWVVLSCDRKGIPPPAWVKPLIYLSIPWAISIHTVTAFIYAGLPGRSFWLTAILAPRFLASAFASGPALLIIFCLILKRFGRFDAGEKAIQALAKIVAYALATSIFFVLMELFTAFYSRMPEHGRHFRYLFTGLEGHYNLVPWMWTSAILAFAALAVLITPRTRRRESSLALSCGAVFVSLWIEKGLGLVVTGFIPSPLEKITEYSPTSPEIAITLGVWAGGFLILTALYKIFIAVRSDMRTVEDLAMAYVEKEASCR
jgi:Ni/Fe-hydrogenase subunit HybB-like protein